MNFLAKSKFIKFIFLFSSLLLLNQSAWAQLNLDKLSDENIKQVENLLAKLDPLIKQRDAQENLATLTFEEFYAPLTKEEKRFLKQFQNLNAKKLNVKIPFRGMAMGKEALVVIKGQKVKVKGKDEEKELPPQFLPKEVYESYFKMMEAMEHDLGKRLYIESGYRSSAYQVYLFVYYLKNHNYSIRETVKFVALPGFSEHGSPKPRHQAIDFINQDGINGEDNPKEFEDLKEYEWLMKNAQAFGFVLSYPKDAEKGITFEPWHWRYETLRPSSSYH